MACQPVGKGLSDKKIDIQHCIGVTEKKWARNCRKDAWQAQPDLEESNYRRQIQIPLRSVDRTSEADHIEPHTYSEKKDAKQHKSDHNGWKQSPHHLASLLISVRTLFE